ncbi:hypothetical protein HLRTI_001510 [Halorhabdus tiamatea SARL4B]|uniref:Uncharacterized protein n=1 Tax=Halorhabdus tiamatea SARL4B TaxID=1033806 RepID=F7PFL1_9EURY|nr:hypothetical protein HLRTI_001510 [Halorhabdus tiamatea SARL4B]CCQ34329.1 hypothetical protein HTIA_2217 [Halorhabdus tiamatea SARL4B]
MAGVTISQSNPQALPRVAVVAPDVEVYDTLAVYCPLCGQALEEWGTPRVPTTLLAPTFEADEVPVFGYRCPHHRREDVIVPAPAVIAPESYRRVEATLDGVDELTVALPPVIDDE